MNASDVCVFPFRKILTSGSVILAMSFGKAVIVPEQGCLKDLVDERGAIFLNDARSLVDCLNQAGKNDLSRMGNHNLQTIQKYDWKFVASKSVNLYKAKL